MIKNFFINLGYFIKETWDDIWWEYTSNDICGPGYQEWKHFKTANLAILISGLTFIALIVVVIILILK